MRKITAENQQIIKRAIAKGILVEEFIKDYGIRFTLKLLKHLIKRERKGPQTTNLICPQDLTFLELTPQKLTKYLDDLKNAGFKIKPNFKVFIDEETGETVSLPRHKIYYFCYKK